jgi:hypothetical protein
LETVSKKIPVDVIYRMKPEYLLCSKQELLAGNFVNGDSIKVSVGDSAKLVFNK